MMTPASCTTERRTRPGRRRAPRPTLQCRSRYSPAHAAPRPVGLRQLPQRHGQPRVLLGKCLLDHPQRAPLSRCQRHRAWLTHVRPLPRPPATLRPPRAAGPPPGRTGPSRAAARRIGLAVPPRYPSEIATLLEAVRRALRSGIRRASSSPDRDELNPRMRSSRFRTARSSGVPPRSQARGFPAPFEGSSGTGDAAARVKERLWDSGRGRPCST